MTMRMIGDGAPQTPDVEKMQDELESLRLQVRGLKTELRDANDALEAARQQSTSAVKALRVLRNQLEPFHLALKMVFGELDAANISAEASPHQAPGPTQHGSTGGSGSDRVHRKYAYWEVWRTKMPGKHGEMIKALLDHGTLSREQMREAVKAGWSTIDAGFSKLNNLGLIERKGRGWTLKEMDY